MHISDGVLPVAVCAAGYATAALGTWYSLHNINKQEVPQEGIPKASLLAAGFFVVSWIHIPIPPTSVHLLLNGLIGAVLGFYAFPAILIALFFQAVMFQHGGLTTLGVNATIIGGSAMLAHLIFQSAKRMRIAQPEKRIGTAITGFVAGAGTIGVAALMLFTVLILSLSSAIDPAAERAAISVAVLTYVPMMLVEGLFTMAIFVFLLRVKPALLGFSATPVLAVAPEPIRTNVTEQQ
ncbi:MAG: cobalt transporter CbiM [Chloroflexota bacterium]